MFRMIQHKHNGYAHFKILWSVWHETFVKYLDAFEPALCSKNISSVMKVNRRGFCVSLSWYFDRDKYKLWFRSRHLTPFKSVCLTLLSINMTELACDCHPFFTQSNWWNILFQILTTNCLTGYSYVGRWCLKSSSDRRFYWNFFFLS